LTLPKPSRSRLYGDTGPTAGWRERKAERVKARLLARAKKVAKPVEVTVWLAVVNQNFIGEFRELPDNLVADVEANILFKAFATMLMGT